MRRPSRPPRAPRRHSRGVALLEVLIAILIFSFGILELARLQSVMTRSQGSAKFRADAVNLAEDVVGLIWTDKPNLARYDSATCATHPRCAEWLAKVAATLPQGSAAITAAAATGDVRVTLTWALNAEGSHTYALATTIGY